MAKDPAFLFYPGDFNTGTQFFSDEQVGKYMRLLMAQHQHGHLPEKHMIFICKSYDKDVFSKFVQDKDGLWYNERLENEIIKRKNYVLSRSKNKEGKTKEKIISKTYDSHMEDRDENENCIDVLNKKESADFITVDDERIYDPMPVLEYYEAALNGRQTEHNTRSWKDVVPEWFRQNIQMDFKDAKHVMNAFSKYLIYNGKPNGSVKKTVNIDDL